MFQSSSTAGREQRKKEQSNQSLNKSVPSVIFSLFDMPSAWFCSVAVVIRYFRCFFLVFAHFPAFCIQNRKFPSFITWTQHKIICQTNDDENKWNDRRRKNIFMKNLQVMPNDMNNESTHAYTDRIYNTIPMMIIITIIIISRCSENHVRWNEIKLFNVPGHLQQRRQRCRSRLVIQQQIFGAYVCS